MSSLTDLLLRTKDDARGVLQPGQGRMVQHQSAHVGQETGDLRVALDNDVSIARRGMHRFLESVITSKDSQDSELTKAREKFRTYRSASAGSLAAWAISGWRLSRESLMTL